MSVNASVAVPIATDIVDRHPDTTGSRLALDPQNTYRGTWISELDLLAIFVPPKNEQRPITMQVTVGKGKWNAPTYTVFADGSITETVCHQSRKIEDLPMVVVRLLQRARTLTG